MSSIQSSLLYSLVLAVVGYFVMTFIGFTNNGDVLFAVGIALGGAFIAIISGSSTSRSSTKSNETATQQVQGDDADVDTKTIYVGNLPYRANESAIRELFEQYGSVQSVRLLKDRQTGKRRGFGFVEMEENGATQAIQSLNESEFQQRTLKVREAKERPEKVQGDEIQAQA